MTPPMTIPKFTSLVLLFAAAALGLALTRATPSFRASRRHPRLAAPPAAADSALLSQVSRAQAATVLAQHPNAPVAALFGL